MAITTEREPVTPDGHENGNGNGATRVNGNGHTATTEAAAPPVKTVVYREPITARGDVKWWTAAVTIAALAALLVSIIAVARHPAPKASSKAAGATAAAAATGQTIDFAANTPDGFQARDPNAPAPLPGTAHNITMHIEEKTLEIAPGVKQTMWTFDGKVPGTTYRGKVGDTFNFTIVNDGAMTHSLDFHAGMVSPSVAMVPIPPGGSHTYSFVAKHAGIFMYHCGTPPVLQHIAAGMYGAVIIDPPNLPPVDHEYVFVQSDLYTGKNGAIPQMSKLLAGSYDAVVFNGYVNQYKYAPIQVEPGQRIRAWVIDDGPSASSWFHVIGTIFDTVYKEGAYLLQPGPGNGGSQALDLQAAQGGFVEFTPTEAGSYSFVTHKFDDAARGAVGVFQVGTMPAGGQQMSH
ncbi:MAG TPA: multicopper oxidase domain-containing protein [Acidimicrobiia bacterium]|nr:multicopper oxidase domain-containing protein [Acidimicrobiia bacterium]